MTKKRYFVPFIFGFMALLSINLTANKKQEKNNTTRAKQLEKKSFIKIREIKAQRKNPQKNSHWNYPLHDPTLQALEPAKRLIVPYKVEH